MSLRGHFFLYTNSDLFVCKDLYVFPFTNHLILALSAASQFFFGFIRSSWTPLHEWRGLFVSVIGAKGAMPSWWHSCSDQGVPLGTHSHRVVPRATWGQLLGWEAVLKTLRSL